MERIHWLMWRKKPWSSLPKLLSLGGGLLTFFHSVRCVPSSETIEKYFLTSLVKYIPDWMPGAGFKRTAKEMAKQLDQCTTRPYQFVKQQMREKRHTPSFLPQSIESADSTPDMEFYHKWAALALYLGGADTVSPLIYALITAFPNQKLTPIPPDRLSNNNLLPCNPPLPHGPIKSPTRNRLFNSRSSSPHPSRPPQPPIHLRHSPRNTPLAPRRSHGDPTYEHERR